VSSGRVRETTAGIMVRGIVDVTSRAMGRWRDGPGGEGRGSRGRGASRSEHQAV